MSKPVLFAVLVLLVALLLPLAGVGALAGDGAGAVAASEAALPDEPRESDDVEYAAAGGEALAGAGPVLADEPSRSRVGPGGTKRRRVPVDGPNVPPPRSARPLA